MLLKSGKQFSLDSHIDIENTTVVGSRAHRVNDDDDQERVAQLSRILGMKCAWIETPSRYDTESFEITRVEIRLG